MTTEEKLAIVVRTLDEKKGQDLEAIQVTGLTIIGDYFVFVTATSTPHVRALADTVEEKLSQAGVEPDHIEGKTSGWLLLDYHDIVIHIFDEKNRGFYQIERLWNDGKQVDLAQYLED